MSSLNGYEQRDHKAKGIADGYRMIFFSDLLKRRICAGKIDDRIGRLSDIAFNLAEPYPVSMGLLIDHGWGKPNEFIPWENVIRIDTDAIFVKPHAGGKYPPFVDQPGWILVEEHLIGKTVLDMDGRQIEVVNDVCLVEKTNNPMYITDVDISFNGFLRRVGLGKLNWIKDQLISWKYIQPLSVEDAASTDKVSLSVTRDQLSELPSEDLADVLEELSGEEQEALFAVLDSEKAAETLAEAEPRTQRQLIADLREERARMIFSEMSVPQLADLFSILPHDNTTKLMGLLDAKDVEKIKGILAERESTAEDVMTSEFVALPKETTVEAALNHLRTSQREPKDISYVYVVDDNDSTLLGVVDLRELILADGSSSLNDVLTSPVVSAEMDDTREDLAEMFARYHYRMIPVVDGSDHILGIIRYNDVMKGVVTRIKD